VKKWRFVTTSSKRMVYLTVFASLFGEIDGPEERALGGEDDHVHRVGERS
jgi:hypothetical protein